jgi:hypothetical protein
VKINSVVVAATHDTSYQNDAGGIKASRPVVERSDTTGYEMGVKAAGTPAGVQDLMPRCRPVVSSLTLLNHRLMAACLRHRRDQKVSLMVARSIYPSHSQIWSFSLRFGAESNRDS